MLIKKSINSFFNFDLSKPARLIYDYSCGPSSDQQVRWLRSSIVSKEAVNGLPEEYGEKISNKIYQLLNKSDVSSDDLSNIASDMKNGSLNLAKEKLPSEIFEIINTISEKREAFRNALTTLTDSL